MSFKSRCADLPQRLAELSGGFHRPMLRRRPTRLEGTLPLPAGFTGIDVADALPDRPSAPLRQFAHLLTARVDQPVQAVEADRYYEAAPLAARILVALGALTNNYSMMGHDQRRQP